MKTLRSVSTAILACLVLAAPAAAATEPTISVTVSAPSATLGTLINYTVSGAGEASQTYTVRIMSLATYPATECFRSNERSLPVYTYPATLNGSGSSLNPFSESGTIPNTDYSALGNYVVCARVTGGVHQAETFVSFSVVEPAPLVQPAASPAPAITPTVAPLAPAIATPSVAPSASAQKLHTALAKCRKLKNKHKRVKCERAAKTAAHHR